MSNCLLFMFANIQKKINIQEKTEKILLIEVGAIIRHSTLFWPLIKIKGQNDVEPMANGANLVMVGAGAQQLAECIPHFTTLIDVLL